MKAQQPAHGIMTTLDIEDFKTYLVECLCGSNECQHRIQVEADDFSVNTTMFVELKSIGNRWKNIWALLTKGQIQFEATTLLSEQQALNYSYALKKASEDVRRFREKNIIKP